MGRGTASGRKKESDHKGEKFETEENHIRVIGKTGQSKIQNMSFLPLKMNEKHIFNSVVIEYGCNWFKLRGFLFVCLFIYLFIYLFI